jgi:hypothetical protein
VEDDIFSDESAFSSVFDKNDVQNLRRLRRKPRLSFQSVINKKTMDPQELEEVFIIDALYNTTQ